MTQARVRVLQMGARLHYGVPAAYARTGALERLYTDACASVGGLSFLRRVVPPNRRGPSLARLLGRVLPPEIAPDQVRTATVATLLEHAVDRLGPRRGALVNTHRVVKLRLRHDGFGDANCLYSVDNTDIDLLREARRSGLAIIYEQIINPSVGRILREERTLFPGIEAQDPEDRVERGIARDIEVFKLADAVICASDFVRDDIASLTGTAHNVHVVPYGISEGWLNQRPSTVQGRVLFVGTVGLRKGTHYLAEATRLLRTRGVRCDVRVVGPVRPGLVERPEFEGPVFLGQVPRDRVRREFAEADLFVLPTLSESFALVHLEALAYGVPVITTPNWGSTVRDGREGFIVPIRDAKSLADRIQQVLEDRALRGRISEAAVERARSLSWRAFGERLVAATETGLKARRGGVRG